MEWINFKDNPPKLDKPFLCIDKDGDQAVAYADRDGDLIKGSYYDSYGGGNHYVTNITHWMPLPLPPVKDGMD